MSDSNEFAPSQGSKKSGWKKPLLIGCLGFLALVLAAVALFSWWAATKGKTFVTEAARDMIAEAIVDSELSEDQQQELIYEIDRLAEGFESDEITFEQMRQIMNDLGNSPLSGAIKVYGAEAEILSRSNITSEEKSAAELILRRYIYGVIENRIPMHTMDELLNPLLRNPYEQNNFEFRKDISDQELRSTIAKAKAYADEAGIGVEDIDADLAGLIRKTIDKVVGE